MLVIRRRYVPSRLRRWVSGGVVHRAPLHSRCDVPKRVLDKWPEDAFDVVDKADAATAKKEDAATAKKPPPAKKKATKKQSAKK